MERVNLEDKHAPEKKRLRRGVVERLLADGGTVLDNASSPKVEVPDHVRESAVLKDVIVHPLVDARQPVLSVEEVIREVDHNRTLHATGIHHESDNVGNDVFVLFEAVEVNRGLGSIFRVDLHVSSP